MLIPTTIFKKCCGNTSSGAGTLHPGMHLGLPLPFFSEKNSCIYSSMLTCTLEDIFILVFCSSSLQCGVDWTPVCCVWSQCGGGSVPDCRPFDGGALLLVALSTRLCSSVFLSTFSGKGGRPLCMLAGLAARFAGVWQTCL